MKIAFDENVPVQMVRVFKALGQEKRFKTLNLEIVSAADYTPKPTDPDYSPDNDVPWLARFASDGGQVIISGDTDMIEVPHELEALRRGAFTVFFFERKWNRWGFYEKTSLLLFHWPVILAKLKAAKRPRFWCVPNRTMRFALSAATLLMVAAGAHVQPVTLGAPKWGCKWIGE